MCKNELFQSSGMKNEFQAKFKDENNNLTNFIFLKVFNEIIKFKTITY